MQYAVTSKRKIAELIRVGAVSGWDDPRLFTISALRRKGYPPKAINDFCNKLGVTVNSAVIGPEALEACVRDVLNASAPRAMAVLDPLKVVLIDYPESKVRNASLKKEMTIQERRGKAVCGTAGLRRSGGVAIFEQEPRGNIWRVSHLMLSNGMPPILFPVLFSSSSSLSLSLCLSPLPPAFLPFSLSLVLLLTLLPFPSPSQTETVKVPNLPTERSSDIHEVPFSRVVYIDRSDFQPTLVKGYKRLAPSQPVGLKHAGYVIAVKDVIMDKGNVVELHVTFEPVSESNKPNAFIHWVSAPAGHSPSTAEVRLYNQLFLYPNPDEAPGGYLKGLNPVCMCVCLFISVFICI